MENRSMGCGIHCRSIANVLALTLFLCAAPIFASQGDQNQAGAPPDQAANAQPSADEAQTPAPNFQPLPASLTVPAGTALTVRTSQFLSSDQSRQGDGFTAELVQPLVVNGWVVARRGQTVLGRVAVAQKAGRIKGVSQLGVELTHIILVDGQQLPIRTELQQTAAGASKGRDAAAIGTTTGLGAAIGASTEDAGKGAAIGAGAGALAGIAGVLLTRGRATVIPPETELTFQMEAPLTFSTARSQVAFRPVNQQDYDSSHLQRRPQHFAVAPAYPPPYYWGYEPWEWGFYPGPAYFGYFGGFGWGGHGRGRFRR